AGGFDIFVGKLKTSHGTIVLIKGFGGSGGDFGNSVACDSAGKIYVTGSFHGSGNFGGKTLPSPAPGRFLMKPNPSGGHGWSRQVGDASDEAGTAIAVDAPGATVAVVGYYLGAPNYGGGALPAAAGTNAFEMELKGSDGSHLWSKGFGNAGETVVNDVVLTA